MNLPKYTRRKRIGKTEEKSMEQSYTHMHTGKERQVHPKTYNKGTYLPLLKQNKSSARWRICIRQRQKTT